MIKDMTAGNPSKIIITYSIPMILSGMFQQFYNIADSLIAGRFAGVDALAAVGASYPVNMLFIAVATGASTGCAVVISQIFGAKELGKMKTASYTAILSMLALSLCLMMAGLLFYKGLMKLLHTPQDVFLDGALYLKIYIMGLTFLFLYNISTAIFNGLGDSKTPLIFLIGSSAFNIALDLLFVAKFQMGVAGVAWATFIAQGTASAGALGVLCFRLRGIEAGEQVRIFDKRRLKQMARIAVPSILQQSTVSIGQLFIQVLVNSYGAAVIAGYSAAVKLDSFFKMIFLSMGNAVSGYAAQNAGAGKVHRIRQGVFSTIIMGACFSAAAWLLIRFGGSTMIAWFINENAGAQAGARVLSVGTAYMNAVGMFYMVFAVLIVCTGLFRGIGYMKGFLLLTILDLIVRVAGSYALAYFIGYNAIWWAISLGWSVGLSVAGVILLRGKWKTSLHLSF